MFSCSFLCIYSVRGTHWASQIHNFMSLIRIRKLSAVISSNISPAPFSLALPSGTPITHTLDVLTVFYISLVLFLCSSFPCFSLNIFCWLILQFTYFSAVSNLVLNSPWVFSFVLFFSVFFLFFCSNSLSYHLYFENINHSHF